jgi:hypothetical protein
MEVFMTCSFKTMMKVGVALVAAVAIGYAAVPALREWLVAFSPFLFLLVCPLAMVLMMRGMSSHDSNSAVVPRSGQTPAATQVSNTDQPGRTAVHG